MNRHETSLLIGTLQFHPVAVLARLTKSRQGPLGKKSNTYDYYNAPFMPNLTLMDETVTVRYYFTIFQHVMKHSETFSIMTLHELMTICGINTDN